MLDISRREFAAIQRWAAALGQGGRSPSAIGDDCAILDVGGLTLALTCDALNEGVHFRQHTHSWEDVAWKLAAASLSDLASVGARPEWGLLSLVSPTLGEQLDGFIQALGKIAERYGFRIIGGDTTRSTSDVSLTLFLIGSCGYQPMLRSAARPGDILCVTGTLGASAAGLCALDRGLSSEAATRHLRPQPRLDEGLFLAHAGVKCCIDISDGLLGDARHILAASTVGCEIDLARIPVDSNATLLASETGSDPLEWALAGGEDYELLFTVCESVCESLLALSVGQELAPISVIGRITERPGLTLIGPDAERYTPLTGYDHFSSDTPEN